jgi:hypothetical protein
MAESTSNHPPAALLSSSTASPAKGNDVLANRQEAVVGALKTLARRLARQTVREAIQAQAATPSNRKETET